MKLLIVTGLVLAVLLPESSFAQVSLQDKDERKRSEAIARLKPGRLVRIHTQNLGEIAGSYHSSSTDSIFITVDMVEWRVPIADIDALWVRGRSAATGAIIGSILVGAGGAIVGIGLNESEGFIGCSGDCPEVILLLGFGGAAGGGLLGAGIGALIPKWHRRYRSPEYDSDVYSNLSEAEFSAYWDVGEGYSDVDMKDSYSSRVRFSIVPDIRRGGINFSAAFTF